MVLDGLGIKALLVGLVIKDLGNNDLWRDVLAVLVGVVRSAICCIAFGKSCRIAEASRVEEEVQLVDPRVYISNLDTRAGDGPAACGSPGIRRVDDLVALAQVRVIKGVVLDALHHRRGCDRLQWRPVKLHGDRVERDIVLAGYSCSGRIGSQPASEIVASSRQLGAVRSRGVTIEINFLSSGWFASGMNTQGITFKLDDRARCIHVLARVEGVSACIRSRRAAHAKCNNAQANRREYQECCEDFFHRCLMSEGSRPSERTS